MKQVLCIIISIVMVVTALIGVDCSAFATTAGDFEIEVIDSDDKTAEITGYNGYGGKVVIPSILNGYKIIRLDDYLFADNCAITALTIPSSVKYIGVYVCNNCDNLTNIVFPEGVISIGGNSFCDCELLNTVTIPSTVKYISSDNSGNYRGNEYFCFLDCESLTSINVDKNNTNYTSIDGVLYNKEHTRLLIYPDGKNDSSFRIPDGVNCIEVYAFAYTHYLTEVIVPCSVTKIKWAAFRHSDNLQSIVLPKSIMRIDTWAFPDCAKFKSVFYESDYDSWKNIKFDSETNYEEDTLANAEVLFNNTHNNNLHNVLDSWNCSNDYHWKQCSCGEIAESRIRHTWNSGTVTKKATPTETGIKTYVCKICGAKNNTNIAKCAKYENTLTVETKSPNVNYKKLKKKNQNIARKKYIAVSKAKGVVIYDKLSGNKKFKINKKTGKIIVKRGLKKGNYKVKIKVKALGNNSYKSAIKTVTVTIKVK